MVLLQVVIPEYSNSIKVFSVALKTKGFGQLFRQPTAKPLKYQSTKTSRVGRKGQGREAHATCQYPKPSLTFESFKIIPVIQSLRKNMPEVSFVKLSHACLMIFTVRYDTGNLPLKPEC